jgi:protease I
MELGLNGRHVAILAADGVDAAEVGAIRGALVDAGAVADVLAARGGNVRGAGGGSVAVDQTFEMCRAADYDALVIPSGPAAVDQLKAERRAVQFVKEFMAGDKPVAAAGDGVRVLIAADAVAGRAVAAPTDVAGDLRNAGAEVVEAPVHVDEKLITSRGGVLDDFRRAIVREFANRVDEARVDQLSEQSFPASDPPPGPVAVGGEGASTTLHLDPRGARGDGGGRDSEARG